MYKIHIWMRKKARGVGTQLNTQNSHEHQQSGRGIKAAVLIAAIVALALVAVLVYIFVSNSSEQAAIHTSTTVFESGVPTDEERVSYSITLDTSAHPGAVLEKDVLTLELGKSVEQLPFATLEGMRFIGWFTGPEDDANAVKVDNNSLELLTVDVDCTLYARFETRPTSIDHDNSGLPIMMYHYFYDTELGETGENANWMDIDLFESHLAYLQSNNYYYPTWEEVNAYIRGEILLPEPSIVLCSDDGFENFFRLAAPLVKQYGARMTSFVVLIDLQPWQIEQADGKSIIIQSHSYDMHRAGSDGDARILTSSYEEIVNDAQMGNDILGNALAYCYPFGKTNENAKQALRDGGVGVALVIEGARAYPLCDPMEVPRLRLNDGATVEYLASVAY